MLVAKIFPGQSKRAVYHIYISLSLFVFDPIDLRPVNREKFGGEIESARKRYYLGWKVDRVSPMAI